MAPFMLKMEIDMLDVTSSCRNYIELSMSKFIAVNVCFVVLVIMCFTFQSYKRVGGQKHSTDMGRGVIGVADITNLIVCLHHDYPIFCFSFRARNSVLL